MCGRYNVVSDASALLAAYQLVLEELTLEPTAEFTELPNYNAAPTQLLPIIRANSMTGGHWGLVPVWAKDRKSAFRMINARAETLATTRAYRDAFRKRRCLVPATGWYEWRTEAGVKQPYLFETGQPVCFAGVWAWNGLQQLLSYSVVTTEANAVASPYHHRMPVLLPENAYRVWLDESAGAEELKALLVPYSGNDLSVRKVSRTVNNVRNRGPECLNAGDSDEP